MDDVIKSAGFKVVFLMGFEWASNGLRMGLLFSSLSDAQNGLPGLLCDRVEVSRWTAELTASLSATGDRVGWPKCDFLFCFSSF
ncbi:hypothetical protein AtNW77_Chr1g0042351 [Arabidopsis thaliana]